MKILILKVQTIGDTLLISSLIDNLKEYFKDARIDILVNEGTDDVLRHNPNIDELIVYYREKGRSLSKFQRFIHSYSLLKRIRMSKYDLLIDLDEGDRGAFISLISSAKQKIGSSSIKSNFLRNRYTHLLKKDSTKHIVETNLESLAILNIPIITKKVTFFWSQNDENKIKRKLKNIKQYIHIHPFSRGWFKDLNIETTAKIIDYCEINLNKRVVITSSPDQNEQRKLSQIINLCNSSPISYRGNLSLTEIGALNKKAKLFIGVDTAIMHISAANNTPTLSFFGPTSPQTWGPWNNHLEKGVYHRRGGIQLNGIHRVISEKRECMPCNNEGCNNSQVSDCLVKLNIEDIFSNIEEMLKL